MVTLFVVSLPISFLALLNDIASLILASGADFLSVFEKGQLGLALVLVFLRLHSQKVFVAQIFWGLLAIPVRDSCHSIRVHPSRLGRLADHCVFRLSGR